MLEDHLERAHNLIKENEKGEDNLYFLNKRPSLKNSDFDNDQMDIYK